VTVSYSGYCGLRYQNVHLNPDIYNVTGEKGVENPIEVINENKNTLYIQIIQEAVNFSEVSTSTKFNN